MARNITIMSRQEEINEFAAMLNALAKKYNVSLGVQVIDLTPKEEENSEVKEAEVVEKKTE